MQFSRFLISRECSFNTIALYNSLCPKPLFLTAADARRIIEGSISDRESKLLSEHYCFSYSDNELFERYVSFNHATNGIIDTLYIILTTKCNLHCDYCAVKDMSDKHTCYIMRKETIKRTIDLFFQYCAKHNVQNTQVCFYGGEPLIAFGLLQFTVSYCKEIGFRPVFSVVSNGTIIKKEFASFIKDNHINISISLDGPKEINDINRKFRGSKIGSYKSAIAGLHLLSSIGCSVGLSLTITRSIIENEQTVLAWIRSLPISGVNCNLLHSSTTPLNEMISLYERSAEFCARIENETNTSEGRFARRIHTFLTSDFMFSDCAAVGINQLTVDPSGDLYYCHCERSGKSIGNVHRTQSLSDILPTDNLNPWFLFAPIERESCLTCPGISICGGGCYGINASQKENNLDIAYCRYTLKTLDIILGQLLTECGMYRNLCHNDSC